MPADHSPVRVNESDLDRLERAMRMAIDSGLADRMAWDMPQMMLAVIAELRLHRAREQGGQAPRWHAFDDE